ncbi:unnamed protein product (macronuclear) [Paramecium tetraurelia]|uniref:Uncharacterized protein n=1 Tax=Paramecium tetraurelia TaxID=5888 RepID=A0CTK3_PARTE|nr:uncharacterized protein GSPATT00010354001 [Paramecium tetraurelia]CAK74120.1 unnamed protein product [Paramecium tetraurelia]|eukprot:XP_001441517.1 hypothetical protein (macronuclear) [Paramecium tetraurelia strain d4-2]
MEKYQNDFTKMIYEPPQLNILYKQMEVKLQNNPMKEQILQDLGENPTEIDIKYISYVTNIPAPQIKQWLEESQKSDLSIDIGSKECLFLGSRKPKGIKSVKIKIETHHNTFDQPLNQQEEQKQINESQLKDNIYKQTQKEAKIKQKNQQIIQKQKLNQQIQEPAFIELKTTSPIIRQEQNQIKSLIENQPLQSDINQEKHAQNKINHQKNQTSITLQIEEQKKVYQKNEHQLLQDKKSIAPKLLISNIKENNQIPLVQQSEVPTLDINQGQNEKQMEQNKFDNINKKYTQQKIKQKEQKPNQLISQNQSEDQTDIARDFEKKLAYLRDQYNVRHNDVNSKGQKQHRSTQIEYTKKNLEIQMLQNNQQEQELQPISISSSRSQQQYQQQLQDQPQNFLKYQILPTQDNKLDNTQNLQQQQQQQHQASNLSRQQNQQFNKQNCFEYQHLQLQNVNQDQRPLGQQQCIQQDNPYLAQGPVINQAYQPSQQKHPKTAINNAIQFGYNQSLYQIPAQTQEQNYCQQYSYYDTNILQKLQQRLDMMFLSQNTHQLTLLQKLDQIINLIQRPQNKK